MAGSAPEYAPEIDRVKGLAILLVIGIHAKIGEGTIVHEQFVNRAVPIFLFVFGLMSELSLQRARKSGRSIGDWYRGRLERLYVPIWGMAALFWLAVLVTGEPPLPIGAPHALLTFFGYSPWIGPSWFVTLVIQLVLVFPALHWVMNRLGPFIALALAVAISMICLYYSLQIADYGLRWLGRNVPPPGWFYDWIFVPRSLSTVVAGMVAGRLWGTKPGPRVTLAAVAVSLFAETAVWLARPEEFIVGTLRKLMVMQLWDVPVALSVLGFFANVPLPALVARPLEWCGRWSWGLYLGHVVVFEVAHMLKKFPESGLTAERVLYGAFLLFSGAVLALSGNALRRRGRAALAGVR